MGFVDAVKSAFSNYANFNGRASRSEYWYWVLFYMILYFAFAAIIMAMPKLGILGLGFLAVIVPSISVAVRRMHDTDRSGWMILISLIPIVGLIVLYWYCLRGTVGPNQFGEDPLG